jgi:sulfatase modifying factor 1
MLESRRLAAPLVVFVDRSSALAPTRADVKMLLRFLRQRLPGESFRAYGLTASANDPVKRIVLSRSERSPGPESSDIRELAMHAERVLLLGTFGATQGSDPSATWCSRLGSLFTDPRVFWVSPIMVGERRRPDQVIDPRPARDAEAIVMGLGILDRPHLAQLRDLALLLGASLADELAAYNDPRVTRYTGAYMDMRNPEDRIRALEAIEELDPAGRALYAEFPRRWHPSMSPARIEVHALIQGLASVEMLRGHSLQYLNRYGQDLLDTGGQHPIRSFVVPLLPLIRQVFDRYPEAGLLPLAQGAQLLARRLGEEQPLGSHDPAPDPERESHALRQVGGQLERCNDSAPLSLVAGQDLFCEQTGRSNEQVLGERHGVLDIVVRAADAGPRACRLSPIHRPPWAERIWRNEEGLFAAHREGAVFQQQPSGYADLPGELWTCRHNPWSWAVDCGVDLEGLWAAFELDGVRQVLRWIPPGTFLMGSPEDELERDDDETHHEVTLTRGYWLGETTVTQALWTRAARDNPSRFAEDPEAPVEKVSWEDCVAWIERVNRRVEGLALRLPTEAEWEYACRAGTTTPFHFGSVLTTDQANYDGNYPYADGPEGEHRQRTLPARSFEPNDWGLYQMHGNVYEWCADWLGPYPDGPVSDPEGPEDGRYRVLRGGSWFNVGRSLRSARRFGDVPGIRHVYLGFRLAGGPPSQDPGAGPGYSADRWPEADRASDGRGDGTGGRSWWRRPTGRGQAE